VFFDYGGTLAPTRDLPSEQAAAAIAAVNAAELLAVVVSNQKGVAQGRLTWDELLARRDAAARFLSASGAHVDAWYFCPHDAPDRCACRKPEPGMLLAASQALDIDLAASAVVGDRDDRDVAAGRAVGALTALVLRDEKSTRGGVPPDVLAPDVLAATREVIARLDAPGPRGGRSRRLGRSWSPRYRGRRCD
jgi:D-glycero-D-manno-heptose 1,7-bisphosphate phosphatase